MRQIFCKFLMAAIFLNGLAAIARADALDNWTANQVNTNTTASGIQYFGLASIAYGNGQYVAVGSHGASDFGIIEASGDGVNWTICGDGDSQYPFMVLDLYDVAYGNGTFVAVGLDYLWGQNLYSSTNGVNWIVHTNADVSNFYGVTYGGGLFVAVGDGFVPYTFFQQTTNRNIYTSPDGITWTRRNSGAPANDVHSIMAVTYGAGRYVAIDDTGYIYTSTLGTTWTRKLISGNSSISSYGYVNYCNGLFIALVNTGTNMVSTEGLSWSPMVKDTTNIFRRVIYANDLYVASTGSTIFTSTNGTNWIQLNFPTNSYVSDITFGIRNIVAVGSTNSAPPTWPIAYVSDPFVGAGMNSGFPPQLKISGLQGRSYRIESTDVLPGDTSNWRTNTTLQLTNSPCIWTDTAATNSQRFYRAVLVP